MIAPAGLVLKRLTTGKTELVLLAATKHGFFLSDAISHSSIVAWFCRFKRFGKNEAANVHPLLSLDYRPRT